MNSFNNILKYSLILNPPYFSKNLILLLYFPCKIFLNVSEYSLTIFIIIVILLDSSFGKGLPNSSISFLISLILSFIATIICGKLFLMIVK